MLFAAAKTVMFKRPGMVFFRRFRRVRSAKLVILDDMHFWELTFMRNGKAYIPVHESIVRIGRGVETDGNLEAAK